MAKERREGDYLALVAGKDTKQKKREKHDAGEERLPCQGVTRKDIKQGEESKTRRRRSVARQDTKQEKEEKDAGEERVPRKDTKQEKERNTKGERDGLPCPR